MVQRRRALGITGSRRRPGTALLAAGIGLLVFAAFLFGREGSGGDSGNVSVSPTTIVASATVAGPTAARMAAITVPDGHDGVAVTLSFAAGGGGYVAAGDHIDVHAVRAGTEPVGSRVLLADVLVLDVSAEVQPRVASGAAERPSTGQLTYLLAIPSDQVDLLVAATQSDGLYLSLRAEDAEGMDDADTDTVRQTVDAGKGAGR
jgi:Flp pilus assembly protein CpaB